MKLRPALAAAGLAALLLFATTGFADNVKTDYNHQIDFSQYHTYSWGTVQVSNQLNAERIKRAINILLKARGWQEVPSGGQVTIMAKDNIHNEQEAETYYNGMGDGWGMGWGWGGWGWGPGGGFDEGTTTTTTNVRVGHLVIDLFDNHSRHLLWRGVSRGELSGNPSANRKRLYADIHRMFDQFPPKGRG